MLHISESLLNQHFAKTLLGEEGTEEQKAFVEKLLQSAREGHLCTHAPNAPPLPPSVMEEGDSLFPKSPIIRWKDLYYLQKNWVYETHLIEQVRRLKKRAVAPFYNLESFEEALRKETALTEEQKEAVQKLTTENFSILCGGPGTGKTYTAGVFVKLLLASLDRTKKKTYRILLAAPTGKAALHLQNSLNAQSEFGDGIVFIASTVHRMLKLNPGSVQLFSKKRIDADLVIIDEASMMDVSLFSHLLEMIQEDTKLVLMGDPNQLPPIEAGNIFSECSEMFGAFLKTCLRTSNQSLTRAATAILRGDEEALLSLVTLISEFDETLIDRIYKKVGPVLSREKIDPVSVMKESGKFRVLNALRKGPFGIEAINQKILERLEKSCVDGMWWAIPIMVRVNSPHLNLFNGSFGVLIGQCKGSFKLSDGIAYFAETGEMAYPSPPPYEISFALSIHKSQGSEFDEIMVLLPQGSENFGREALYTATTRAKRGWEVIATREMIGELLKVKGERLSGFSKRMRI